jgi:endogenous inhibitor of DNA gyrase (YacG/DUF329 family)
VKKVIHVHCPCCRNQRLFDIEEGAEGIVSIKCPVCRTVVEIKLDNVEEKKE